MPDDEPETMSASEFNDVMEGILEEYDGELPRGTYISRESSDHIAEIRFVENEMPEDLDFLSDEPEEPEQENIHEDADPGYRDPRGRTYSRIPGYQHDTVRGEEIGEGTFIPQDGSAYVVIERRGTWTRTEDGKEFYACLIEAVARQVTDRQLVTISPEYQYWTLTEL